MPRAHYPRLDGLRGIAVLAGLAAYYVLRPGSGVTNYAWLAWCAAYVSNYVHVVRVGPMLPVTTWHFWSLAVEEQFYLLWPFVVWHTSPARLVRVSAVLVVAALVVRIALRAAFNEYAAYNVTFARMDALIIGGMLAVWQRDSAAWARVRQLATPVGVAAAAGVAVLLFLRAGVTEAVEYDVWMQRIGYPLVAVAAGAWIVRATATPATGWLARGPLPWLGRYAYGLYVYHVIIAAAIVPTLFRRGWIGPTPEVAPGLGTVTALAVGGALTVAVAVASYHWFEVPFLRLKRLFPTPSAGTTAAGTSTPGVPFTPALSLHPAGTGVGT